MSDIEESSRVETNPTELFSTIENRIVQLKSKLDDHPRNNNNNNSDASKFELIDRNDLRSKLRDQFGAVLGKHWPLLKRCLQTKPSAAANTSVLTQETCVRLLTLSVQHAYEYAKQIAVEFNYFNDRKNWLERFLLVARSDLREMCIEFLMSYLKYTNVGSSGDNQEDKSGTGARNEQIALVKRILFKTDTVGDSGKSNGHSGHQQQSSQSNQPAYSSLVHCLFVNIHTDSRASIEFMMHELFFKFVQNEAFTKADRVRLFNDRTLASLVKLYSWRDLSSLSNRVSLNGQNNKKEASNENTNNDESSANEEDDNTMTVREIVNEFLKTLFCSTRHGINFYDKSLNLNMSSERTINHLIFTTLINLPRFGSSSRVDKRTNEMIEELILKTFRVCPDLIQRFLKVKHKQAANKKGDNDEMWLLKFSLKLLEQQQSIVRAMAKNPTGTSSYLRSLCNRESIDSSSTTTTTSINPTDMLINIIIHTSFALHLSFPKLIVPNSPSWTSMTSEKRELLLSLLVSSLQCLKTWCECLSEMKNSTNSTIDSSSTDEAKKLVVETVQRILDGHDAATSFDSFTVRFSLDIGPRYVASKDALNNLKENSNEEAVRSLAQDAISLYSEVFEQKSFSAQNGRGQDQLLNDHDMIDESNFGDSKKSEVDINLDVGLGDDDDDEQSDDRMDVDNDKDGGIDVLPNNLDQLVATYSYTMSARDLKLVSAIHRLDPSLDCLVFKLLESQTTENSGSVNDTLSKQAKITDFISLKLNDNLLAQSVLNFPLGRKLDTIDEYKPGRLVDSAIYDPVYMLPNIYHLLDYANVVDVIQFVHSRLLSYLLAALSSECDKLRSLAYASIYRFVSHVENTRAYFRNIILYLVNFLRNSLEKSNQRLPTVITVFLAETIMVIIKPGTTLYRPLTSFLLLKPSLDLYVVPEFYKLFNSSSMEYKTERKWILNIVVHSCRTSLDYRAIEKRYVFRQLMGIYSSKLSDWELRDQILTLVLRACHIKYALVDLIKRHFLLVWLTSVLGDFTLNNSHHDLAILGKLIQIYSTTWSMLGKPKNNHDGNEDESKSFQPSPPLTYLNQMFVLAREFFAKLELNQRRLVEIRMHEKLSTEKRVNQKTKEKDQEKSASYYTIGEFKKCVKELFVVNDEVKRALEKYGMSFMRILVGDQEEKLRKFFFENKKVKQNHYVLDGHSNENSNKISCN